MMTKHGVGGALVGGWLVAAALIAAAVPFAPVAAQDTVRDSLLVSDSVYQGWKSFELYCSRCHGQDAIGGVNPATPDLRWVLSATGSAYPRDSFENSTLKGDLANGMPAFNALLDTSAVKELYLYVKARSDAWLKPGRPHRLSDLQPKSR